MRTSWSWHVAEPSSRATAGRPAAPSVLPRSRVVPDPPDAAAWQGRDEVPPLPGSHSRALGQGLQRQLHREPRASQELVARDLGRLLDRSARARLVAVLPRLRVLAEAERVAGADRVRRE